MSDKRFILYDGLDIKDDVTGEIIPPCLDKGLKRLIDLLNNLSDENEQLKKDLIDHSALISMLEDYQALKIEDTLFNLTGAKSEEEFNELYKPYLEKAKRCWR